MSSLDTPDDPPPSYQYAVGDGATHSGSNPTTAPESTPVHPGRSQVYTHTLRIVPNTRRSELAYPTDWAPSHNVSARDWDTFVARLLSGATEARSDGKWLSDERVQHMEGVIRGWNQDFFQPRGVLIRWEGGPLGEHVSASSSAASPLNFGIQPTGHHSFHDHYQYSPSRPPAPTSSSQLPSRSSLSTKQRLTNKLKNAAKERNVSVTSSKIRVGDAFSLDADTGNVKIGKFSLTDRGVNYDGRPIGPQIPPHMLPQGHAHAPPHAYGSPYGSGRGYPPSQRGHFHGAGGPAQYPGSYGPPRQTASWGSSPMPPHHGAYGPQTRDSPAQMPYSPPQGPYSYVPPPQRGSWSSYDTHHNPPFSHGQPSGHQGQTNGTTW